MRLTEDKIIKWAIAHRSRTGKRATARSGHVHGTRDLDWSEIDGCLEFGGFGLPGGSSLSKLLRKPGGIRIEPAPPRLTVKQILAWADAYHDEHGKWPTAKSGPIAGTKGETWLRMNAALVNGFRGLSPGSSLAKFLAKRRDRRHRLALPKLTVQQVLVWADEHHERTGTWPMRTSGAVYGRKHETWGAIDSVLIVGGRGLRVLTTLSKLMAQHRGAARGRDVTRLPVARILEWADAHFETTGDWPSPSSGPIETAPGETWNAVDVALKSGARGLAGETSLGELLRARRGVSRRGKRSTLTIKQILQWADAHRERTGAWPKAMSGPVVGAEGEVWMNLNAALTHGLRGLSGKSSLRKLLVKHRGIHRENLLTIKQILAMAEAHFERTGRWPTWRSGDVADAQDETWERIDYALYNNRRGLQVKLSLRAFLREYRNVRVPDTRPPFERDQILAWADEHLARGGTWPTAYSGPIVGVEGESWWRVDNALRVGNRGWPGGSCLSLFLKSHRDHHSPAYRPRITIKQILAWADEHHARTGQWPSSLTGEIPGSDHDSWESVQGALISGSRGLKGGTTLAQLLTKHRGVPNRKFPKKITVEQILAWADDHKKRTGAWPIGRSGPIRGVTEPPDWKAVHSALQSGSRGMPGDSSLAQFLEEHRGVRNLGNLPELTIPKILEWAKDHHERTGQWPRPESGPIHGAPGENWQQVYQNVFGATRGLPAGFTIAHLLQDHFGVRHPTEPSPLTFDQILEWIDAYHQRHKRWPVCNSGPIDGVPGESWRKLDDALRFGRRNLGGQFTLATFLNHYRR